MPDFGPLGKSDFIQYWSAFKLLLAGANPYDVNSMFEIQRELKPAIEKPIMMWNPPWLPLILSPILWLPFQQAAYFWLFVNICLLGITALLIRRTFAPSCSIVPFAVVTAFFSPCWESLAWGQVSILLTFALTGFLCSVEKNRDVLGGVCLALLSVKPHLFIVMTPLVVFWVCYQRRWLVVVGFVFSILALSIASEQLGDSLNDWFNSFFLPADDRLDSVASWHSAVLADAIRYFVAGEFVWLRAVFTVVAFGAAAVYFSKKERCGELVSLLPPVLPLTFIFAPYGWYYDQSVLLLIPLLLYARVLSLPDSLQMRVIFRKLSFMVGFCYLILIGLTALIGTSQHHFFWVPFLFLLLWSWTVSLFSFRKQT